MNRTRLLVLGFIVSVALVGDVWWIRSRGTHDQAALSPPKFEFNDLPPNLDALPLERRKIEVGTLDGWKWAKLSLDDKLARVAPVSRSPLVFYRTEKGTVHLAAFDRAESALLHPAVDSPFHIDAAIACSPAGGAYAFTLAGSGQGWPVFPGFRPLRESLGLKVGGVIEARALSPDMRNIGFVPVQFGHFTTIRFSPDAKRMAVGVSLPMFSQGFPSSAIASTISIWDLADARSWQTKAALGGYSGLPEIRWESGPIRDTLGISAVQWSPDGSLLASTGHSDFEGTMRRSYIRDKEGRVLDFDERVKRFKADLRATTEEQREAACREARGGGLTISVWEAKTGRLRREWRGQRHESVWPWHLALRDDGSVMLAGGASRKFERGHRFELMAFDPAKDTATRRGLGKEVSGAAFFGPDLSLLVVRHGIASVENAMTGEVESALDLKARFGVAEKWQALSSADSKAVALWHESGVVLYRTRP
jgi:hypothetical protein